MTVSAFWRGGKVRAAHHSQWNDFTTRFPLAAAAVASLPANSFLIDGEVIVTNAKGLAVFDLIRQKRHGDDAVLIAFDLIALDGEDLRRWPIEDRKRKLAKLVRGPHPGIVLNEFFEGDGDCRTFAVRVASWTDFLK
jgi:bifunctional non-homologous end joining protein LigD